MGAFEAAASFLALLYVILAIKELRLCWLVAIVSSCLYLLVFFDAQLYTESALQIFFIVLAVKGWRDWDSRSDNKDQLEISTQSWTEHVRGITVTAGVALAAGMLISEYTTAQYAIFDSAITCFSIYTTWLVTRKILENWIYWIVIDLAAALLYYWKELYLTSLLYLIYVVLAYIGFRQWQKLMKMESTKHQP